LLLRKDRDSIGDKFLKENNYHLDGFIKQIVIKNMKSKRGDVEIE
jgi:hypothetical protein